MSVKIGHARIDENGNIVGGIAGDNNGLEVCVTDWYLHSKGWTIIRAKDANTREKIAYAAQRACDNNNIGYDQNQRYTAYDWCKYSNGGNYDPGAITIKCEVDCSALVRLCCAYAGIFVGDFYTANEVSILNATGKFTIISDTSITNTSDYLVRGDILVTRSTGHTVIVLSNGAKSNNNSSTVDTTTNWKATGTATSTDNGVNVRLTPNGTVIGQVNAGNRFEVDGQTQSGWTHVKVSGIGIGWIYNQYVKYDGQPTTNQTSVVSSNKVIGTATAKTTMNIRDASNTNGRIYGTVSKGTKLDVLEVLSNGWMKVVYSNASVGYAYVSNRNNAYFDYAENKTEQVTTSQPSVCATQSANQFEESLSGAYKTTTSLNVRYGAGTGYKVMVTIPKGTTVHNYGYYNKVGNTKWLFVQFTYKNVTYTGFCSKTYLQK